MKRNYAATRPLIWRFDVMTNSSSVSAATTIARDWRDNPRWKGITRAYTAEDVVRLRGTIRVQHSCDVSGA